MNNRDYELFNVMTNNASLLRTADIGPFMLIGIESEEKIESSEFKKLNEHVIALSADDKTDWKVFQFEPNKYVFLINKRMENMIIAANAAVDLLTIDK